LTIDGCAGGLVLPETVNGNQLVGATKQTVLVVDDEELVRNFIERVLVGAGFQVIMASSGNESMGILKATAVDLVITDIRMPGMDGRDLGALISKLPLAPPVMYASASDHPPHGKGTHYLQKPFKGAELVRMAQEILSQRRDPDE
jgi:two-component system chemotaxis response regulator CheY